VDGDPDAGGCGIGSVVRRRIVSQIGCLIIENDESRDTEETSKERRGSGSVEKTENTECLVVDICKRRLDVTL